jgi:hypothetical protein
MRWVREDVQQWEELRPYVDTALLPVYLFDQTLPIPEHVKRMTYLSNLAMAVEQRLRGRILLFPTTYQLGDSIQVPVPTGFACNIALRFDGHGLQWPDHVSPLTAHTLTIGADDLDSALRFDVTVDILSEEITSIWKKM